MMEYRNPVWDSQGGIYCEIKHQDFGWIPFTARHDDVESHGRELFEVLKGIAKPYVKQKQSKEELAIVARSIRNELLEELDFVVMNPLRWNTFSSEKQEIIRKYRQNLLDIPQQKNFPANIDWPAKPDYK
jgi:hypothetical protein